MGRRSRDVKHLAETGTPVYDVGMDVETRLPRRKIRPALQAAWLAGVAGGLAWLAVTEAGSAGHVIDRLVSVSALLAAGFTLAARVVSGFAGACLLRGVAPAGAAWRAYTLSQLGKYIPGGVWQFLGRHMLYRDLGIDRALSTRVIALETVLLLTVTGGLGASLLSVFLADGRGLGERPLLLALIALSVFALAIGISRWLRGRFGMRGILEAVLMISLAFTAHGIGLMMLLDAPMSLGEIFTAIQLYAAGFFTGSFAVFAPSGIGVREGVIYLGTGLLGGAQAVGPALIAHRIILIVTDCGLALMAWRMPVRSRSKAGQTITRAR